jgi:hypothetical protein
MSMGYSAGEVADRMEIQDKISLYCHAFDKGDFDALDAVFAPDCIFDFTAADNGTRDWSFMKRYLKTKHTLRHDQHYYTNIHIEFDDGSRETAKSVSKVFNPQSITLEGEEHFFDMFGEYHDWWSRTPDGWRSVRRQWNMAWIGGDYPLDQPPGARLPAADDI